MISLRGGLDLVCGVLLFYSQNIQNYLIEQYRHILRVNFIGKHITRSYIYELIKNNAALRENEWSNLWRMAETIRNQQ